MMYKYVYEKKKGVTIHKTRKEKRLQAKLKLRIVFISRRTLLQVTAPKNSNNHSL